MSAALQQADVMRAFFAVELDTAAREAAAVVRKALAPKQPKDAVRWVEAENYHVTLRFLGNIEADGIDELLIAVEAALADARPFELELTASQGFPKSGRPRGVVLGLEPAEPLVRVAEAVERAVVACGHKPERRAFRAHLTLGRVRRGVKARDLHFDGATPDPVLFPVREVVLFRSELTERGPVYTAQGRIPLGAA